MFDQLKAMGAITDLLKNQDKMRAAAERVKDRLEAERVVGEAGGGAARVTVTGSLRVLSMEVSPALVGTFTHADPQQRALAQAVLVEATNEALTKAQGLARAAIEQEMSGMGLGGLMGKVGGLLPGFGR